MRLFHDTASSRAVLLARLCAALSLLGAVLVYAITHLRFPDLGLDDAVRIGGVAAWICILSGSAACLLSLRNRRRRRDHTWRGPVAVATVALVLLLAAFYGP